MFQGLLNILLAIMVLAATGCSSSRKVSRASDGKASAREAAAAAVKDAPERSKRLVEEAYRWIGTPYVYGGTTRSGTDCSGFLQSVYRNALGISIPRSTREQSEYCANVKADNLEAGDLVFFNSNGRKGKVSHVGLYVGNGKIVHASSSRGVIESRLSEKYYTRHYNHSGRVPAMANAVKKKKGKGKKKQRSASKERQKAVSKPTASPPAAVREITLDEFTRAVDQAADSIYSRQWMD